MMANSYEILLKIGGQLESSFGKSVSGATKSLSGLKSGLSSMKGVVVGALGALGAGFSLNELISSASKSEDTLTQLQAVIKSTGGAAGVTQKQAVDLASSLSGVTKFSKGSVLSTENMLLTFTNISKDVFPQTTEAALNMSQALGQDVTSSAMQLGKALNDPATGLAKLTKIGVTFNAQQQAQIKAMVKAGNTAGAQKVILAELNREFGNSAKSAGQTFSGQLTIMKNTVRGTITSLGSTILPVAKALLPQVLGMVKQAAAQIAAHQEDIKRGLSTFASTVSMVVQKIMPVVEGAINFIGSHKTLVLSAITGVAGAMGALKVGSIIGEFSNGMKLIGPATSMVGKFGRAFTELRTAPTVLQGLSGAFSSVFGFSPHILLVVAAIAAVAAIAFVVIKNWKPISQFFIGIWNNIKGAFSGVGSWFKSTFEGAKNAVQGAWSNAGSWFSSAGSSIQNAFNATINWIKKNWKSLALFLVNPIAGAASLLYNNNPKFRAWADSAIKTIKTGFANGWNQVKNGATAAWNAISGAVKAIVQPFINGILDFWKAIQPGLSNIMNGIKSMLSGAWTVIKNIVLAPVLLICDIISGNFGKIGSDLAGIWNNIKNGAMQVWSGLKQYFSGVISVIIGIFTTAWNHLTTNITVMWNAIKLFFVTTWTNIITTARNIWNAIPVFFATLWTNITTAAVNAWNGFKSTITTACLNIKAGIINVWNAVINWFRSLPGTLLTIGANMFTSMRNGVSSTVNTVVGAVKSGIGNAVNWIKNLPQEAVQWGKDMINGIANGIKAAADHVKTAVGNVAQNIRSFLHFSVPDQGPLADANAYGPDFMKLYAGGITKNIPRLKKAAQDAAKGISGGLKTTSTAQFQLSADTGGATYQGGMQQGAKYIFAPQLSFGGSVDKSEVMAGVVGSYEQFKAFMDRYESDKQRTRMRK
jgi:phage-related protein